MKKIIFVSGIVLSLLVCSAVVSMACPNMDKAAQAPAKADTKSPCGKKGPCPPMGSMMSGMMGKSMVATSDGGVVVLIGNRLLKYDKNLNLVKEVQIKMEPPRMGEGMPGMPMMSHAMPQMTDTDKESAQDTKK